MPPNLQGLLDKIQGLSDDVTLSVSESLSDIIADSGILEICVDFVEQGQDITPVLEEFFLLLESEYEDEYESIFRIAQDVAIEALNAVN